jgi:hypothetical protein
MLIGQRSTHAGPPSRQKQRSHFVKVSAPGSYVMREVWGCDCPWLVAIAMSEVGKMHASSQRPHDTHVSSLMKRAPVRGSTCTASTGQT